MHYVFCLNLPLSVLRAHMLETRNVVDSSCLKQRQAFATNNPNDHFDVQRGQERQLVAYDLNTENMSLSESGK